MNPAVAKTYSAADLREDYPLVVLMIYCLAGAFLTETLQDLVKQPAQKALWDNALIRIPALMMEYDVPKIWAALWEKVA
jgi:hypothetical protein